MTTRARQTRRTWLLGLVIVVMASPVAHASDVVLRRVVLVAGANDGGPSRVRLRYADSDARAVGAVLSELGGVAEKDLIVLEGATRPTLLAGFRELAYRAERARRPNVRVEAVFYYSGHSDEAGLLLGKERVAFKELRALIKSLPADVHIAIVDSCASGALVRAKGGVKRAPFLVDTSVKVSGHAFLTSSSADEIAQESDAVGGSFFTHYLLSGLRGAADISRDGQVTLNEAYRYAYDKTLARTEQTRGGAQHAAYDIQLAGTGDLVMTDIRATGAGLELRAALVGRVRIRDSKHQLVAELDKRRGQTVVVGLSPGTYRVSVQTDSERRVREVRLRSGRRARLDLAALTPTPLEVAVARGGNGPVAHPHGDAPARVDGALADGAVVDGAVVEDEGPVNHRLFNAALVPGLSMNSGLSPVENRFAINILAGDGDYLDGFEFAFGVNLRWRDVAGTQLGAAANLTFGTVTGFQLAGGYNQVNEALGGMQLAGGANVVLGELNGFQLAGGANYAGGGRGAQLGVVNVVGGEFAGSQIGLVNVGGVVQGAQIGLVNYADDVYAPVGLLNIVRDGLHHVSLTTSDLNALNIGLRLGGRYFYTLLQAGLQPHQDPIAWTLGAGFGGHFPVTERVFVAVDLSAHWLTYGKQFIDNPHVLSRLRAFVGFRLADRFAIVAGAAGNILTEFDERRRTDLGYGAQAEVRSGPDGPFVSLWPGFFIGIEI